MRITEIMYNPAGGEPYEFVELKNVGALPVDLSLAFFTGIDFTFPRGTVIEPGEFKLLVADFRRFRERYPEPDIHGVYTVASRIGANRWRSLTWPARC